MKQFREIRQLLDEDPRFEARREIRESRYQRDIVKPEVTILYPLRNAIWDTIAEEGHAAVS